MTQTMKCVKLKTMASEKALQRVGIAWTTPETEHITLDSALGIAFANIVDEIWAEDIKPNLGCATTGELIDEIRARVELNDTINYRTIDE